MVLLVCGCRRAARPATPTQTDDAPELGDSLVTSSPRGVEVWFTLTRKAEGPDGKPCLERGLEIRQRGARVPVPLLYTGEPPIMLNDSTMRATLWNHCRPVGFYLVDLRTGRPVREPGSKTP